MSPGKQPWIEIIPREPGFVPPAGADPIAVVRGCFPDACEISAHTDPVMHFRSCGKGLELVSCPHCQAEIEDDDWQDWMDGDCLGEKQGFRLFKRSMPCCASWCTLNDLDYVPEQGFSRFVIRVQDSGRGGLVTAQLAAIAQALGGAVRVVYPCAD